MGIDDSKRNQFADLLYEAQRTATPIAPLTEKADLSIADAYDVQSRLIERHLADGATVVGHKIGLTSDAIQDQLGVDEPDFGRLLNTMFFSDPTIPTDSLVAPRVEPEIGFVLGDDLEPPVTHADVLKATEFVVPVLEIIDSRIRDWEIDIQDTIADNASSARYLVGETRCSIDDVDLSLEGVKLYRNGTLEASGVGAAVLSHPARAVAWLANTLEEYDQSVESGHIILSGSFTPAVDITHGDAITVEFATAGTLHASVE